MHSLTVFAAIAVLLTCYCQHGELAPLEGSSYCADDLNHQEDFMIKHGVTQEEIEEFHRAHGYSVPSATEEDQVEGRTLGRLLGGLKFWNWPAFENFRQWIHERRSRTTTLAPIPIYFVQNPHETAYNYDH